MSEEARLLPADAVSAGWAVGIDGDTVVVGAPGVNVSGGQGPGSAAVYVRSGHTWTPQARLVPTDGAAGDQFGLSVAVSGDTVLVGAPVLGHVYAFEREGGAWTQRALIRPSQPAPQFGTAVALQGDTAIVGAIGDGTNGVNAGAVYAYVRTDGTWVQQGQLLGIGSGPGYRVGWSVALSGDTAVVGALAGERENGAAYVFTRTGAAWAQQVELLPAPAHPNGGAEFGYSVAISGDTIVVGALTNDTGLNGGSAYVFRRTGTGWTQQARLRPPQPIGQAGLGYAVAVSGDTLVVGAGISVSALYVFDGASGEWLQQTRLSPYAERLVGGTGRAIALSGDTIVAGAFTEGSAYVYRCWLSHQAGAQPGGGHRGARDVPSLHRPRHRPRR